MKYLYHGTVVESDRPLDSAVFTPYEEKPADRPTEEPATAKAGKKPKKA